MSDRLADTQTLIDFIRDTYAVPSAEAGLIPLHAPCFDDTENTWFRTASTAPLCRRLVSM